MSRDTSNENASRLLQRHQRLLDEYEELRGTEIRSRIDKVEKMVYAVTTNGDKLLSLTEEYRDGEPLHGSRAAEGRQFDKEYARLFHNYCTSTYSLYNYTMEFNNDFLSGELQDRYDKKADSYQIANRSEFWKHFRHYTQKRRFPPLSRRTEDAGGEDEYRTVVIRQIEDLLEWDGWNSDAEDYLETINEHIDVTVQAQEYNEIVEEFYDWYCTMLREEFEEEIMLSEEMGEDISKPIDHLRGPNW